LITRPRSDAEPMTKKAWPRRLTIAVSFAPTSSRLRHCRNDRTLHALHRAVPGAARLDSDPNYDVDPTPACSSIVIGFIARQIHLLSMDTYRVIPDGPTDFAVEVTHRNGVSHTTGGFHDRFAACVWLADRLAVAKIEVEERGNLRHT
jgi:hypothetical protein